MIYLKALGALMLLCSGIFGGLALNSRLEKELLQLSGFIRFTEYVKKRIECFSEPLPDILACGEKDPSFEGCFEECGYPREKSPKSLYELQVGYERYSKEGCLLFDAFLRDFGKCYRERQVSLCDSLISDLNRILAKEEMKLSDKKRLNLTLCISGSLIPIIILL